LPENFRGRGREHLVRLTCTAKRYFRALLVMMCLTFAVLAVGLLLLRIKNAVLLALLISLLDMLPVIGIGIILLPWAVWNLIIGNYFLGFGLLILFAAATIIREALEPRIVGGNIGMSAMATMFSMWCGFCLLGVAGLIVGPIAGVVDWGARDGRVKRE
jgi:predicted PurR-regulated permease PerM